MVTRSRVVVAWDWQGRSIEMDCKQVRGNLGGGAD